MRDRRRLSENWRNFLLMIVHQHTLKRKPQDNQDCGLRLTRVELWPVVLVTFVTRDGNASETANMRREDCGEQGKATCTSIQSGGTVPNYDLSKW